MSLNPLNNTELQEILQMAKEGEKKFQEMSDYSTIIAEKWKLKREKTEKSSKTVC